MASNIHSTLKKIFIHDFFLQKKDFKNKQLGNISYKSLIEKYRFFLFLSINLEVNMCVRTSATVHFSRGKAGAKIEKIVKVSQDIFFFK